MSSMSDAFMDVLDLQLAAGYSGREAIDPFMGLSAVLLERPALETWLGRAYLKTLVEYATPLGGPPNDPAYAKADIRRVLDRYTQLAQTHAGDPQALARQVQSELLSSPDAAMANVTRCVASLWYCAGIMELGNNMGFLVAAAPIETYSSALVWQAVGGNPMGIPGPYYGNWAYPAPVQIIRPDSAA